MEAAPVVTSPPPPTGNLSAPQPPLPKSSLEDPEFVEGEAIVLLRPGALEAIPTLHERPGLEGFRFELGPWVSPDRAVLIMRPKDEPEGRVSREATRALPSDPRGAAGVRGGGTQLHPPRAGDGGRSPL